MVLSRQDSFMKNNIESRTAIIMSISKDLQKISNMQKGIDKICQGQQLETLISNLELLYRHNPSLNIMIETDIGKSLRMFTKFCKEQGGRLGPIGQHAKKILDQWHRKVLNVFFDPTQPVVPVTTVKPKSLLNQVILDQEELENKRSLSIMSDLLKNGRAVTPLEANIEMQNEAQLRCPQELREGDFMNGEHSAFKRVNSKHSPTHVPNEYSNDIR